MDPTRALRAMGRPLLLLLVLSTLHRPSHGSTNVVCVMNSVQVLTCTWNHPQPPSENFTFYYREKTSESRAVLCPEYLRINATNIGCRLPIAHPYEEFEVQLNSSRSALPIQDFKKHQDYVRMDRPSNLSTEMTRNQELIVRWAQAYGGIPKHCVTYRVRQRSTAADSWTEKDASSAMSSLSSFDLCHNYTFQVKSQISKICANAVMWSEWSEGVTWARNATACDDRPVTKQSPIFLQAGIAVGVAMVLVVIVLAVIGQERIWVILVPQIPNPGKKFEELINGCSVQEWVGVSKEAIEMMKLNYSETFCTVTEDPDCADGKKLTPAAPENVQL